jgi:hypothetical protein
MHRAKTVLCVFILAGALLAPGRAASHRTSGTESRPPPAELPHLYTCSAKPTPKTSRTLATMDRDMFCDVELSLKRLGGIVKGNECRDAWRTRSLSSFLIYHPRCPKY